MKHITLVEARPKLGDIVRRTSITGEVYILTYHGKDAAAVISIEDLEKLKKLNSLDNE